MGGGGFGEYLAEGRLNRIWGEFLCVGEVFRAVGGGSLAHGRFLQVQSHVSVKRQAEARSVREPCAGPNVCGVQCDRDRGAVSVPPFFLLN